MNDLVCKVAEWGYEKGILTTHYKPYELHDIRKAQWGKTLEEVNELHAAILEGDKDEAIDSIGDIIVTLVMQAELWNVSIEDCLESAYEVISKRTGKMVDGQFVKDKE